MAEANVTFPITVELGNKITGYLGTRPYGEVAGLISEIQTSFKAANIDPKGSETAPTAGTEEKVQPDKGDTK